MGIGAISGFGGFSAYLGNYSSGYKISSVHGNPKSLSRVEKIGQEQYSGNPFAIATKDESENDKQAKESWKPVNYDALLSQMSVGNRFMIDGIPSAE